MPPESSQSLSDDNFSSRYDPNRGVRILTVGRQAVFPKPCFSRQNDPPTPAQEKFRTLGTPGIICFPENYLLLTPRKVLLVTDSYNRLILSLSITILVLIYAFAIGFMLNLHVLSSYCASLLGAET